MEEEGRGKYLLICRLFTPGKKRAAKKGKKKKEGKREEPKKERGPPPTYCDLLKLF